jgi:hypothetical protein
LEFLTPKNVTVRANVISIADFAAPEEEGT